MLQNMNENKSNLSVNGRPRITDQIGLSKEINRTPRLIRDWTKRKLIPVIKMPGSDPLYDVERVIAALNRFEVREVGRK
jgi:hypothetical protein